MIDCCDIKDLARAPEIVPSIFIFLNFFLFFRFFFDFFDFFCQDCKKVIGYIGTYVRTYI